MLVSGSMVDRFDVEMLHHVFEARTVLNRAENGNQPYAQSLVPHSDRQLNLDLVELELGLLEQDQLLRAEPKDPAAKLRTDGTASACDHHDATEQVEVWQRVLL